MGKKLKKIVAIGMIYFMSANGTVFAAPSEVYGSKVMKKWDYHKVNYDKDGKIRYKPNTVEFNTDNENHSNVDLRIPKLNSKDTKYGQNVEITYDMSSPEGIQWESNIYRITKIDRSSDNPNLEQDINFKVKEGKITLYSDSRPIDMNGVHGIKIYANGYDAIIHNIHIVEKAPTIKIYPDYKPLVNEDILLELRDFNYAVANPIYEVLVDGNKLEGNCEGYHVISNLIRIENSGKIQSEGEHTITVKAHGYEDASITLLFRRGEGHNLQATNEEHSKVIELSRPKRTIEKEEVDIVTSPSKSQEKKVKVDTVTSASKSQKKEEVDIVASASQDGDEDDVDTVSGASGSLDTQASLVFDFDLISNAYILRSLGMETKESKRVLDIWEGSTKDAAKALDSNRIISWDSYINAVEQAKVNKDNKDKHLTFEEYVSMPAAEDYLNRPYNVKYILEDGLYGEIMSFETLPKKDAPLVSMKRYYNLNENVLLNYEDHNWAENIERIVVGNVELRSGEYEIKEGKIILRAYRFTRGVNDVVITSKGYTDVKLSANVQNNQVNLVLEQEQKLGQDISIVGVTKDYVRNIKSVMLDGKMLLSNEATGGTGDYSIQMDKILLGKSLISDKDSHMLIVRAYGYEDAVVRIVLESKLSNAEEESNIAPELIVEDIIKGDDLAIKLSKDNAKWRKAIEKVEVNERRIDSVKWSQGKDIINIDGSVFNEGKNSIKIYAKGYDNKVVELNVLENTVEEAVKEPTLEILNNLGSKDDAFIDIILDNNKDYTKWFKNAIVKVNGKEINENLYTFQKQGDLNQLVIKNNVFEKVDVQKVEVESLGYGIASVEFNFEEESLKDVPEIRHANHMTMNSEFKMNSSHWSNNLTEVKIKIGEEVVVLQENVDYYTNTSDSDFIIKSHNFNKEGKVKLSFKSKGYKDSEFELMLKPLYEVPSDVRLLGQNEVEIATEISIGLPMQFIGFEKAYKVEEVHVNGEKLENTMYKVGASEVKIFEEVFTKEGEYEIVLKANKYMDAKFIVKVLSDTTKPEVKEKVSPSIAADNLDNLVGKDIELSFNENEEWRNNISNIKVNDVIVDLDQVKKAPGVITLVSSLFQEAGTYNIEVISSGYENQSITQEIKEKPATIISDLKDGDVDNSKLRFNATLQREILPEKAIVKFNNEEIQPVQGIETYEVTLLEGSNTIVVSDENGTVTRTYVISYTEKVKEKIDAPKDIKLQNKGDLKKGQDIKILVESVLTGEYKEAITKVYVNNIETAVTYESEKYFEESMIISGDNFDQYGDYTIRIEANGYKDFETRITIKELIEELTDLPVINDGRVSMLGIRCDIKKYSKTWHSNIEKVTINGVPTKAYAIVAYGSAGEFSLNSRDELQTGENIILIKSNRYKDITFKILN